MFLVTELIDTIFNNLLKDSDEDFRNIVTDNDLIIIFSLKQQVNLTVLN